VFPRYPDSTLANMAGRLIYIGFDPGEALRIGSFGKLAPGFALKLSARGIYESSCAASMV
jgi:hypothetical protein